VVGEGEYVWPQLLADWQRGDLSPLFKGRPVRDLREIPGLPRDLLNKDDYLTLKVLTATRGCPNSCTFCAAGSAAVKRYRVRPIEEVVSELEALPGRFTLFLEDNLGGTVSTPSGCSGCSSP
jgi:radical SAM superfamily enzyme YgiQ (UPF0313 family)